MTPEGRVKSAIDKLLKEYGAYYHKPVQNGMGSPALDYWVCHQGFFAAIEAKGPDGHMTDRQIDTATEVTNSKGSMFCVNTAKGGEIEQLRAWLAVPYPGALGTNFLHEYDLYVQRRAKNAPRND